LKGTWKEGFTEDSGMLRKNAVELEPLSPCRCFMRRIWKGRGAPLLGAQRDVTRKKALDVEQHSFYRGSMRGT
jgi:hypothetical protein